MFRISNMSMKIGVRQIERWIKAAQQDKHPGVMMLHANYAVGDLVMLREMVRDSDIKKVTGIDPFKLYVKASLLQDKAEKRILQLCPQLAV